LETPARPSEEDKSLKFSYISYMKKTFTLKLLYYYMYIPPHFNTTSEKINMTNKSGPQVSNIPSVHSNTHEYSTVVWSPQQDVSIAQWLSLCS
jgi:hypothetical protein